MPRLVAWNEVDGYVSAWSITHFLFGFWWALAWTYSSGDALPWLNLLLMATVACLFELFESTPYGRSFPWGWLGYDDATYPGDSLANAVTDVIFALVGWTTVRIVVTYTRSTTALLAMLGASAVLCVLFWLLLRVERRVQGVGVSARGAPTTPAAALPALMLAQTP